MFNLRVVATLLLVNVSIFAASSAEDLINQNGCLFCHAVASKKAAPAFAGIGIHNKRFEGADVKVIIINSIKNGSSGKYRMFSDSAMPAFKNFSDEDLSIMADYILSQSSKARGQGKRGGGTLPLS